MHLKASSSLRDNFSAAEMEVVNEHGLKCPHFRADPIKKDRLGGEGTKGMSHHSGRGQMGGKEHEKEW